MSAAGPRVGVVVTSQHVGGAEQHLLDLYGGLRPLGIIGTLLGAMPGWESTGCASVDLGMGPKWSRRGLALTVLRTPGEVTEALARVRAAHAAKPFTTFHAQFKREQILLTRPLSRLAPVVWTEHGRFVDRLGAAALRRAYRMTARWTERIICVSQEVADDVSHVVGAGPTLEVIDNAVDPCVFHPVVTQAEAEDRSRLRDRLGVADHQLLAVVAARLHPAKDIGRAIAASRAAGIRLVVAGDGPERGRLAALGGDTVTFLGHQSRPELAGWLRAGDLLLYCAMPNEGSPLAVLEAAASGLALVSVAPPPGDPGTRYVLEGGGAALASPALLPGWLAHSDIGLARRRAQALAAGHLSPAWLERYRLALTGAALSA